jgi:hypothetical protein
MDTTGVMMLDKKMASDCVAADEREFSESMKTTAPTSYVSYSSFIRDDKFNSL